MGKSHRKKGPGGAKGPVPQLRSRNTRSSKGRLISEPESSTSQLTSQLSLLGLYAAPTIGDGNCLFRALSDQLYGSPSRHHELRQQICDHIERHRERYEPFVEDHEGGDGDGGGGGGGKGKGKGKSSSSNNSGSSGLEGHVRAMRENATYGGHMELSAFADMTRRNVKVIQPGLVYVIERNSGWDEAPSAAADTKNTSRRSGRKPIKGSSGSGSPSSSSSPGSSKRREGEGEETKVKLGKGYYVYEEVTSDEEDQQTVAQQGPTIYVAYHDWEHFSSIRNLRGPHTGLPDVVETPPPPHYVTGGVGVAEVGSPSAAAKEAEKKKLKANRSGTPLKVKLRLPAPTSSPPAPTQRQQEEDPSLIPLPTSRSASPYPPPVPSSNGNNTSNPLPPSSLSVEVYPEDPSSSMQTEMQVSSSTPPSSQPQQPDVPLTQTQTHTQVQVPPLASSHHHHHQQHGHLQTPRAHYRSSPKRTFDESSASGEDVASGVEGGGGPSSQKRRRRRSASGVWDGDHHGTGIGIGHNDDINNNNNNRDNEDGDGGGGVGVGGVPDIVMRVVEGDEDGADTPSLSLSGSSSSSSSLSSASVSEVCSDVDEDGDDGNITAKLPTATPTTIQTSSTVIPAAVAVAVSQPASAVDVGVGAMPEGLAHRAKQKYIHQHQNHHSGGGGGAKSLTRRQRKALGLPKHFGTIARSGSQAPSAGAGASGVVVSAGKIIIPGGKWKGRASMPSISGIGVGGTGSGVVVGGIGAGGQDANRNQSEDSQEWRKNGTGRVDVRGFRELKI